MAFVVVLWLLIATCCEMFHKAVLTSFISGFGITFMDLLERARQQHQVTTKRPENPKRGRQGVASRAYDRPQGGPGRSTASPVLGQVSTTLDKFRSRQSTASTNDPTTRHSTVITTSSTFTTETIGSVTETSRRETMERGAEKLGVVGEETTVEPTTGSEAGISVSVTEPVMMLYPDLMSSPVRKTEFRDLLLTSSTTPPFLPERPRSGPVGTPEVKLTTEIPATSTLTAEEIFTTGTIATTEQTTTTRQIPTETSTAEQVATITEKLPSTETETLATATTLRETTESMTTITEEEVELDSTTTEEQTEATTRNPGWISSPERRPKRIRTDGGDREQGVADKATVLHSGQYHEVNPGQYKEVHPGQYHEKNPGQYHEVRQRFDSEDKTLVLQVNPGQYHEVHPGQVDVESVKVDFQHRSKDRYTKTNSRGNT